MAEKFGFLFSNFQRGIIQFHDAFSLFGYGYENKSLYSDKGLKLRI